MTITITTNGQVWTVVYDEKRSYGFVWGAYKNDEPWCRVASESLERTLALVAAELQK